MAMELYLDDIKFSTPEEAKAWWEVNYGEDDGEEDEIFWFGWNIYGECNRK